MASSRIQDIRAHTFLASEKFFLDANVWLSMYGPSPVRRKGSYFYSAAWRDIRSCKCEVLIDMIVLSEFINTYSRIEQKQTGNDKLQFKSFRKSAAFKPIAAEITRTVKRILSACSRVESGFPSLDIDAALKNNEAGTTDFNDEVISNICAQNGVTLITHDADFAGQSINILTANARLLPPPAAKSPSP